MQGLVRRTFFYDPLIECRAGLDSWGRSAAPSFRPAEDVIDEQDKTLVRLDVPGVAREDISIEVQEGVLSVSGQRVKERSEEEGSYRRLERLNGSFSRSYRLADGVDAQAIEASLSDGVLELSIPKPEKAKPVTIEVSVAPELEAGDDSEEPEVDTEDDSSEQ